MEIATREHVQVRAEMLSQWKTSFINKLNHRETCIPLDERDSISNMITTRKKTHTHNPFRLASKLDIVGKA